MCQADSISGAREIWRNELFAIGPDLATLHTDYSNGSRLQFYVQSWRIVHSSRSDLTLAKSNQSHRTLLESKPSLRPIST